MFYRCAKCYKFKLPTQQKKEKDENQIKLEIHFELHCTIVLWSQSWSYIINPVGIIRLRNRNFTNSLLITQDHKVTITISEVLIILITQLCFQFYRSQISYRYSLVLGPTFLYYRVYWIGIKYNCTQNEIARTRFLTSTVYLKACTYFMLSI